jgi:hypothetical protein
LSNITYKQNYSERVKDTQKRKYLKRKLECGESETKMIKYKKVDNSNDNSCESLQIPGTCHSNLKVGKLPSCSKANKMTFPEKPEVLKNLTPLEERIISPIIPFMQVRELPSGGQLSIHGM